MATGRIEWGSWLLTIISWDGLLPPTILLVPYLVGVFFPNNPNAFVVVGSLLPTTGFVARFVVGRRHILSNHCGIWVRRVQSCFLYLGLLALAMIDAVVIIFHLMPAWAACAATPDYILWAVLASIYLTSMIIAMYPGRTKEGGSHV